MRFTKSLLIAAVTLLAPFISHASPVLVTSDPTLSIGGMTFNDFTCSITKGGFIATPSNCSQIKVGTITTPGTGIEFNSGFSAAFGSFDDAVLSYKVSSDTGISNIGLNFDGDFLGLAVSSVVETVFSGGTEVGQATVSCSPFGCNDSDTISLNGSYNNLSVEKDIYVGASYIGIATDSIIDQTFDASAPEPSSFMLLGTAFLGVGGLIRRRAKATIKA
ncbi:MAG TPA: PEP-CTERM sorting domain-containing protein [Bryobacteraceae bacterium]|nr:PEP-CTERM sorting domain-containing protein [Bryobacteraceae bacterium]